MKTISNPSTAGNQNRALKKRSGPFEVGSPKATNDGKDLSKNAKNVIGSDPGRSPQAKPPKHF